METSRRIGTISKNFSARGYFWVSELQPDGTTQSHFAHVSNCKFTPREMQIVTFTLRHGFKGTECRDIELLPEPSPAFDVLSGKKGSK
jgi:hypothetical protein